MMARFYILLICLLVSSPLSAQWIDFNAAPRTSLWASSVFKETLGGKVVSYGPEALFDRDSSTPWVEAAEGDGLGENVIVLLQSAVTNMKIINGFAASERLFKLNNRPKTLKLTLLAGLTAPGLVSETDYVLYFIKEFPINERISLKDSMAEQQFGFPMDSLKQMDLYRGAINQFREDFPDFFNMISLDLDFESNSELSDADYSLIMEIFGFYALKLTIADVYRGDLYSDTCISELAVDLEPFF
ncbi:NADase-type glycan-binding domain-containing protein [Spirochaeta isovalerica]|uniref:NAD glycohydrolase translocation F5/8 type C domain-containing protein n=1 Tax=Spirochaeta isovalerica TaxID=150 RepID=A0A841RED2_9SPIO|nr:hypothetical protein [Spirochaeta isovalerica]MBB6482435.1 hypothetical protein [Spirochaeta isovalerica]